MLLLLFSICESFPISWHETCKMKWAPWQLTVGWSRVSEITWLTPLVKSTVSGFVSTSSKSAGSRLGFDLYLWNFDFWPNRLSSPEKFIAMQHQMFTSPRLSDFLLLFFILSAGTTQQTVDVVLVGFDVAHHMNCELLVAVESRLASILSIQRNVQFPQKSL